MRHEQAQTFAIFNAIGDGAIVTDSNSRVEHINEIALNMLGYRKSEVMGGWFPELFVAEDESGHELTPIERPITRSFITGKPVSRNMFYRTKSGKRLPVAITVSPVVVDEKPVGAIHIIRDNTYEFEVDKMKSEFISIASHQLRTPLSAIKTYSHMLESGMAGKLTAPQKEFIKTILDSTNRMNVLIDALLNASRLELGKIKVKRQKVKLEELINQTVKEARMLSDKHSIKIVFKRPRVKCDVNTDALLVKEIVSNLLSNAVKYTPDNGKVEISLAVFKKYIQINVSDNGYGIPEGAQARIFTKFFRAANAQVVDAGGSGLGLYTVQQIVSRLGGKIWFDSIEDEGTTFFVRLPLKVLSETGKKV
jgi:PAS domain S-box-containing protein